MFDRLLTHGPISIFISLQDVVDEKLWGESDDEEQGKTVSYFSYLLIVGP